MRTNEGAALASVKALVQLASLMELRLYNCVPETVPMRGNEMCQSANEGDRPAAFLELLAGTHPSLQLVEVEDSFLRRMKEAGLEARLAETLRRRGWVAMESNTNRFRVVFGAPGLCVQL